MLLFALNCFYYFGGNGAISICISHNPSIDTFAVILNAFGLDFIAANLIKDEEEINITVPPARVDQCDYSEMPALIGYLDRRNSIIEDDHPTPSPALAPTSPTRSGHSLQSFKLSQDDSTRYLSDYDIQHLRQWDPHQPHHTNETDEMVFDPRFGVVKRSIRDAWVHHEVTIEERRSSIVSDTKRVLPEVRR